MLISAGSEIIFSLYNYHQSTAGFRQTSLIVSHLRVFDYSQLLYSCYLPAILR